MIKEIDGNTAKLKSKEPKFYSITVSPSKYELKRLQNNSTDLKKYTRELMKEYVKSFNREINGRAVTVNDIMYYAKIEHQRSFKGTDMQVRENQPYATIILQLQHEIRKIERGEAQGKRSTASTRRYSDCAGNAEGRQSKPHSYHCKSKGCIQFRESFAGK